jgi:DNA-binding Lrp family transcriptional regulator
VTRGRRAGIHVDRTDVALVRALEWDARAGTSNLAARLRIDRGEVEKRRSRLESEGVIRGYRSVVMVPYVLGGDWSWVEIGVVTMPGLSRKQVLREITSNESYVFAGDFNQPVPPDTHKDLSVLCFTCDSERTLANIRTLESVRIAVDTHVRDEHDLSPAQLDETDWDIVAELIGDGRRSAQDVAFKLGFDEPLVSERLDALVWNERNRSGVVIAMAETNWRGVSDFAHVHFSLEVDFDRPTDVLERRLKRLGVNTFSRGAFFPGNLYIVEADVWGLGDLARLTDSMSRLPECELRGQAIWQESFLAAPWLRSFVSKQHTLARRRASVGTRNGGTR